MIRKKMIVMACTLATCAMMSSMPVLADTASYNWKLNNTVGTLPTGSGYKNDSEQNYYITISSGNVSSSNIFGTRIRRAADDALMSKYVLHRGLKMSVPYAYSAKANTTSRYYMKGKKDSASSTTSPLNVAGKVTY